MTPSLSQRTKKLVKKSKTFLEKDNEEVLIPPNIKMYYKANDYKQDGKGQRIGRQNRKSRRKSKNM